MKGKIVPFILGVIVGVVLIMLATFIFHPTMSDNFTKLNKKGECYTEAPVQVIKVIDKHYALVVESINDSPNLFANMLNALSGKTAVLKSKTVGELYDGVVIEVPEGKCLRIIGTYSVTSDDGSKLTSPAIELDNK